MLFFEVLQFTDDAKNSAKTLGVSKGCVRSVGFLSVNGKASKKSMAHGGETTRSAMLFFEVLPFADKNNAASLGVSMPLRS